MILPQKPGSRSTLLQDDPTPIKGLSSAAREWIKSSVSAKNGSVPSDSLIDEVGFYVYNTRGSDNMDDAKEFIADLICNSDPNLEDSVTEKQRDELRAIHAGYQEEIQVPVTIRIRNRTEIPVELIPCSRDESFAEGQNLPGMNVVRRRPTFEEMAENDRRYAKFNQFSRPKWMNWPSKFEGFVSPPLGFE